MSGLVYSDGFGNTDPNDGDNSDVRLSGFPAQGTSNKVAGVEMHLNTVGYENIAIFWDQRNSDSANRYSRVQYSVNAGVDWMDGPVIEIAQSGWVPQLSVSLADVPAAANNPDFALRLVAEFVSTATGAGPDSYAATLDTANYAPGGQQHYDMVYVHGESLRPRLEASLAPTGHDLQLSWSADHLGFSLEESPSLDPSAWVRSERPLEGVGALFVVTIPLDSSARFFRLRRD